MTQLKITGMTCDACAKHLRKALESVPGVQSAQVFYPDASAEVAHEHTVHADSIAAINASA